VGLEGYPQGSRFGHLLALAVAGFGVVMVLVVRRRHRALRAAMAPVLEAPTVPLRPASAGAMVELAVQVSDDAPLYEGPLTGEPVAFYGISVVRGFKQGKNHSSELESDRIEPPLLPIVDDSGPGYLDLAHAEFDLRAVRHTARSTEVSSGRWDAIVGAAKARDYAAFELEQRHLSPGEQLYVLGLVHRREPTPAEAGYRTVADVPVIGAAEGAKVVVHAGTERDLLANLRRERTYLDLLLAAFGALTAAVIIAAVVTSAL
jgi:hypothetical protein